MPESPTPTHLENDRFALRNRNFAENRVHDVEELLPRQLGRWVAIEIIDEIVQKEICACGEWKGKKAQCEKIYGFKSMAFKVDAVLRFPGMHAKFDIELAFRKKKGYLIKKLSPCFLSRRLTDDESWPFAETT